MDTHCDHWLNTSNDIWLTIMDQLIELKKWQNSHEEAIRKSQTRQLAVLSEQNVKLDALTAGTAQSYGNGVTARPTTSAQTAAHLLDDSLEEFRAAEQICLEASTASDMSFGNKSFTEDSAVVPGINGKDVKTFEELLNKRLSDQKVVESVGAGDRPKPKKPFLRKGEGIKRFGPKLTPKTAEDVVNKCVKRNETKNFVNKTKPKVFESRTQTKRNDTKSDTKSVNMKPFARKVIPLTTKMDKNVKSVVVSRNTPTVIRDLDESESELLELLQELYGNVSIDDNSIDSQLADKDINELQELLQKIELKKNGIQRQLNGNSYDGNDRQSGGTERRHRRHSVPDYTGNNDTKKKVHWSPQDVFSGGSDDSEDELCEFSQPKAGAYSSALKRQINELEERLSRLKTVKPNTVMSDKCVDKEIPSDPLNGQLSKLTEQIERLNKRIINMESNSYDLIKPQMKEILNNKQNTSVFSRQNISKGLAKTRAFAPNGNISVNESPNDTTINFANGDKMTVSKDNTIFYTFANGATQTTYADGLKIINFPNGQSEKVYKTGIKHITYMNGLQRIINPDGSEEVFMTDGTVWRIHSDGSEVLEFANGDREIRTDKYKRREYSSGNTKTLYSDGTEETRYICGRLRIKDRFGNLMVDSMIRHLDQHID